MAKNPFKKQNIVDTAINVAVGGVANVAIDYVVSNVDALATMEEKTINIGKFVVGAVASSMVGEKMLKAAFDGIAVVGVSGLAKNLMDASEKAPETTTGVPYGTVGRIRRMVPGHRRAAGAMMRGIGSVANYIS